MELIRLCRANVVVRQDWRRNGLFPLTLCNVKCLVTMDTLDCT